MGVRLYLSQLLNNMSIIILYLSGIVSRCKVGETYDYVGAGDAPSGVRPSVPKKKRR